MTTPGKPEASRGMAILSLLAIILLARFCVSAARQQGAASVQSFSDFSQVFDAGARLNAGQPLYSRNLQDWYPPDIYIYPPTLALAFKFLAPLGIGQAKLVWVDVMIVSILAGWAAYWAAVRWRLSATIAPCAALLTAFRFHPTTYEFFFGQTDLLILALVCGMYWANSRGKFEWCGAIIAAAALLKSWGIVLVLWLVVERRWIAALVCAGTWAAAMAAMFAYVGFGEFTWFVQNTQKYSDQPLIHSITLKGLAQVLFRSTAHAAAPLINSGVLYGLFLFAGYLAMAWSLWVLFRSKAAGMHERHLRFSFIVTTMLVLLPIGHIHYAVLLIPVLWTCIIGEAMQPKPGWILMPASIGFYLSLTMGLAGDLQPTAHWAAAAIRPVMLLGFWGILAWTVVTRAGKNAEGRTAAPGEEQSAPASP